MTGVEDALNAGIFCGLNGIAMLPDPFLAERAPGNDQHLFRAFKGLFQAGLVCEVTMAHTDATLLEVFSFFRIANANPNSRTGKLLQELFYNLPT